MQHALSQQTTTELLHLLHTLSTPEMVDQTRLLPHSCRTLLARRREPESDEPGGVTADTLHVASGDVEVTFLHFRLVQVIQALLESVQSASECDKLNLFFQNRRVVASGERFYDELHSGTCWRDLEAKLQEQTPTGVVLPIILYVDGVLVDFFGKINMIPLMLTLGTFSVSTRQSLVGKRLVGFIPSLSEEQIRIKTRKSPSAVRREVLHSSIARYDGALCCPTLVRFAELNIVFWLACCKRILEEIIELQQQGGILLSTAAGDRRLFPVLMFVGCDNKEAVALASIKSGQTRRPCRHCMCQLESLNEFREIADEEMRDSVTAMQAISNGDKHFCMDHSVHLDLPVRRHGRHVS